ncbi:HicA toxin of toxin-antitoxin [Aquipseudomonas alcaligenes]|uniref:type II toxin-antitoxin system HicA family toxin n=1 Tax=Aquipseudomonas alcaligenes TaxID=43263 RepID=UPI0009566E0B|nr:type II toxin-antitoxin system HicA family toxin [Pseudomonas alcaligenes]SIR82243.1 HicA toxin of toxin-antitoxin [Pseudomonas alcaligenes]
MSKRKKLLERFKQLPKDFEWSELCTLLGHLGYEEEEGSGARKVFQDSEDRQIHLHKPHPGNIIKEYLMKQIKEALEEHGKI